MNDYEAEYYPTSKNTGEIILEQDNLTREKIDAFIQKFCVGLSCLAHCTRPRTFKLPDHWGERKLGNATITAEEESLNEYVRNNAKCISVITNLT